jgi:hypothetical protein
LGSTGAVGKHSNLQIESSNRIVFYAGVAVPGHCGCAPVRAGTFFFIERQKTMQIPSRLWGESRTRLLQGIAIGAVASVVIGFSWGGWMTSGTANKLAAEQADTALVAAFTPICVEKFLQNGDAKANLAALQKISTNWEQGDYLEKGGWATRPGATSPDYKLARACATKLNEAKTAAQ